MESSGLEQYKMQAAPGSAMRIAVCDDDAADRARLLSLIAQQEPDALITQFESGDALLLRYSRGSFDLIFIDIYMPGRSGVETVRGIRSADGETMIVFTTTSTEHALEGYRLDIARYLEKPVEALQLKKTLAEARRRLAGLPALVYKQGAEIKSVPFCSIMYAEQNGRGAQLCLSSGECIKIQERLDSLEQKAPASFYRSHKSYLVNLAYVRSIDRELMVFSMCDGQNVHIRRESLSTARKKLEEYLFMSARGEGQ